MVDQRTLPNDRFGYSVYTVVAHASPEQVRMVADVRRAINLTRATIPAHVTVRGTFHSIKSLDEIRGLLRHVASQQKPASVEFSPEGWKFIAQGDSRHIGIMPCETTPGLVFLNRAFDAVIRPHSTNAYSDEYRAHMTLCQDCTEEQIIQAKALAGDLDIGTGFTVNSVELMGRVGPAFGGEWKLIESFQLGG
jgi:2'-5' RNA ligase